MKQLRAITKVTLIGFVLVLVLNGCASSSSSQNVSHSNSQDMNPILRGRLDAAAEYLRKNNHLGARDHLQKALELDRSAPEVYDLLALLYAKELEYDLAEQNYRKALSLDHSFTRGYNNFGSFLYRRGRYEEACQLLEQGGTDVDYIQRANVFYKLGLCRLKLDDRAAAYTAFQKVIALSPLGAQAYLEIAELELLKSNIVNANKYLGAYKRLSGEPNAKSLWLEARIAHLAGNSDARDSHGLALVKLFAQSEQAKAYKHWVAEAYAD